MLIAVLAHDNLDEALAKAATVREAVDAFELRLDYLANINLQDLKSFFQQIQKPVIITLRSKAQGGKYSGSESKRLALIESIAALQPHFMDLEFDVPQAIAQKIKAISPNTKLIRSYHNFDETPDDLSILLESMQAPEFDFYKIVTTANSTIDSLRMLCFAKQYNQQYQLSAFCMGTLGLPSRVLGKIVNNHLHYASIDAEKSTAPGQLTISELIDVYRFKKLNTQTEIYGLMGDPVDKSIGHIFHNQAFSEKNINAVYVKFNLKAHELSEFFHYTKQLPIKGLSVTMPLKTEVMQYLNEITSDAQAINAVNTIHINSANQLIGINTDGEGAISAIADFTSLKNKKMIILGAGGSAKAIAYEATQAGAKLTIVNRTLAKAEQLAKQLCCKAMSLNDFVESSGNYDILINTTPIGMDLTSMPIPEARILANTIIMDIVYHPKLTPLLSAAKAKDCQVIFGEAMFIRQAQLQLAFWFESAK